MVDSRAVPALLAPLGTRSASLTEQVVVAVRRSIREGRLVPGHLYSAYQLADSLGVSRSPVREALLRLAEAGMVSLDRNRGFRVVVPSAREIAEVFDLRLLLEGPAAARVAASPSPAVLHRLRHELGEMRAAALVHDEQRFMSHDQQLHRAILEAAANQRVVAVIDNLRDLTRLRGASTVDRSRSLDDIAREHEPIVVAVERRDPAAAATAMAAHLAHTGQLLLQQSVVEAGGSRDDAEALWTAVTGRSSGVPTAQDAGAAAPHGG